MNKIGAAFIALLLPCLVYAGVAALTEHGSLNTDAPAGRENRAAIAIRDDVTPFQKWGTREFTAPYLDRYYDHAWYFTQSGTENRRQAFLACLNAALKQYPEVDLFLLAHSNQYIAWVAKLPLQQRRHLRLIYNTGCHDLQQGPAWLKLGAKAYVGHPGESASPVFYIYFLRRWTRGAALKDALNESNRLMQSALVRGEAVSFGNLDAAKVSHESEAFCYGESELRIQTRPK